MFNKVKNVFPLEDYKLLVQFCVGVTKIYDVKPLFEWKEVFNTLKHNNLFYGVYVDVGGYGIVWNDYVDLSCDELWENGVEIKTPFDGLMSMNDATTIWGLNESTLRKAISYGKLKNGIDVCKYGKQWVVSIEAMNREYGQPKQWNINSIKQKHITTSRPLWAAFLSMLPTSEKNEKKYPNIYIMDISIRLILCSN